MVHPIPSPLALALTLPPFLLPFPVLGVSLLSGSAACCLALRCAAVSFPLPASHRSLSLLMCLSHSTSVYRALCRRHARAMRVRLCSSIIPACRHCHTTPDRMHFHTLSSALRARSGPLALPHAALPSATTPCSCLIAFTTLFATCRACLVPTPSSFGTGKSPAITRVASRVAVCSPTCPARRTGPHGARASGGHAPQRDGGRRPHAARAHGSARLSGTW